MFAQLPVSRSRYLLVCCVQPGRQIAPCMVLHFACAEACCRLLLLTCPASAFEAGSCSISAEHIFTLCNCARPISLSALLTTCRSALAVPCMCCSRTRSDCHMLPSISFGNHAVAMHITSAHAEICCMRLSGLPAQPMLRLRSANLRLSAVCNASQLLHKKQTLPQF